MGGGPIFRSGPSFTRVWYLISFQICASLFHCIFIFYLTLYIIIGDAELSSIAAGLAVGKRASISADSALGRSSTSIITGTTAGVTQFSEVSQLRSLTATGLGCSNVPYSIPRIWWTGN